MALHGALDVAATDKQMFVGLTKSDPFWTAGRCQAAQGTRCPSPCTSICSGMAAAFCNCMRAPEQHLGRLEVQTEISCTKQSRVAGWNFNTYKPPCLVHSNKNLLSTLPQLCNKRFCLTRDKGFKKSVAVVMLMIHLSLWLYTQLLWHKRHTHNTIRLLHLR